MMSAPILVAQGANKVARPLVESSFKRETPTVAVPGTPRQSRPQQVSLSVKDSSLGYVLRTLTKSAGLGIVYDSRDPMYSKRVSVEIRELGIMQALEIALRGTGLIASLAPNGETVMIRKGIAGATQMDSVGTMVGRVVDTVTQKGIAGVVVTVMGTTISAVTKQDGSFRIPNVGVGSHTLSVKLLGYVTRNIPVLVDANKTKSVTIFLHQASTTLSEVVTTATGVKRSYEVGSDITRINVDEVRKTNDITTVAELLATRVPGMFNQSGGGDAGAGSTLRIRGVHSISLNNDPVLIIDGVRVAGIGQTGNIGNTDATTSLSSRLNDIDPASIETIEVLKGPSAATLYGPDAANGVIVITRKRGLAGETRWTINGSTRFSSIPRTFPNTKTVWGRNPESNDPIKCDVTTVPTGSCAGIDSITSFSPLNDPYYSTMGRGYNNNLGLSLQTGTSTIQTSLTFRLLDQTGVSKLSDAAVLRLEKIKGTPVPSWARRPNSSRQYTGDANVTLQSVPLFDLGFQANAMHLSLRNSGNGIGVALRGNDSLFTPEKQFLRRQTELSDQYTLNMNVQTRRWKWVNWNGTIGLNGGKFLRDNWQRAEDCIAADCSNAEGERTKGSQTTSSYTVNSFGGIAIPLSSWGTLRSTVGFNLYRTNEDVVALMGRRMALGVSDPAAGLVVTPETQSSRRATAGMYLEERFDFRNRLFFNAAIRQDVGSALGQNAKTPTFPKFDMSWIALKDPVSVPLLGQLSTLRLRAALGQSGHQPALSDLNASILRSTVWHDGAAHSAYLYQSVGNSYLQPERTSETEVGVDFSFAGIIEELRLTYFRHLTQDAIVSRPASAETGLPDLARSENLGKLRNSGVEASTSLRLIDNAFSTWNLNVSFSQTKNKVLSLGQYTQMPSSGQSVVQRVAVGYPVFGLWARPVLGYEDLNHDGVLSNENELIIGDSVIFAGWGQPRYTMNYHSSLGLWRGNIRVSTTLSQTVGITKHGSAPPYGGSSDDLVAQALDMAYSLEALQTVSSLTWNSADLSIVLPKRIVRRIRAMSGTFSVTASNLYQWTSYRGADPNVGPPGRDNLTSNSNITPNSRNWALRFSLTY